MDFERHVRGLLSSEARKQRSNMTLKASISSVELCCFTRYRVWKTKLLGVQEIEK